jgi:DNA repair exonuclease SbcCD ATPase subunit
MRDAESRYRDYRDYKDLKKKLDRVNQRDKEMADKVIALKRLQTVQKEAASMSLESIINTINGYAEEYLHKFFDETISVKMTNVKETQTKVEYSLVNIDLFYNDKKYMITEFSQGELIKINLSFILAMNRLQGSTYLFLDEILQNLDKGVLLEIYATLKSITKDVSVFIIDHNSNEGFFDDVLEFVK